MSDAQRRNDLYARLRDVLGDGPAETLMNHLPEPNELATVHDIRGMGSNIEVLLVRIDERMERFEERMDRFEERMDRFEERLGRHEAGMVRFDDRLHDFNQALREHTRTILYYSVIIMFGMVAGAVALASVL